VVYILEKYVIIHYVNSKQSLVMLHTGNELKGYILKML
jgi:hypothetical protein